MSADHLQSLAKGLVEIGKESQVYPGGENRFALRVNTGEKWNAGLSASGLGTAIHHTLTRRNARVAMQDSMQCRAIVTRMADTVADGGMRLELSPVTEVLGITRKAATTKAREVEARFHLWAKDKKQHRGGHYNWYQAQCLWQFFRQRDNDQFMRFYYDSDPQLQNPLQFDFLDPDQVRGDAFTNLYGFNQTTTTNGFQYLADGIQRDARGREVAYKTYIRKDDNLTYDEVLLPKHYAGGRLAMLHGFKVEYAGQGRGFSRLAHAIQELENITDFSAATIKKAINQSNIVGFVEPSKDEDAVNPFDGILTNQGAGPAAKMFGSNPQFAEELAVGNPPDIQAGIETCYQVPEATMDTPGSMFIANLTKGSKIVFAQNSTPGDSFDKFVDSFMNYLSASYSMPLEVVLMKFGQNYSASRATLLLFFNGPVAFEREDMAVDLCNPTVEAWLGGEIAAGKIVLPGWSDPVLRAAWLNCTWIASGPPDIDPAKSAKAAQNNIEMGRTNIEREARDFNGTSAAVNIAKNNETYKDYKSLPWNEVGNPPPGAAPDPNAPVPAPNDKKAKQAFLEEIREVMEEVIHG